MQTVFLQAGEDLAAIIAAGSEQAKIIRQQQGRDAGLEYLEQIMREVLTERDAPAARLRHRQIEKQRQDQR